MFSKILGIILAGGPGTRLNPLTSVHVAKPVVPYAGNSNTLSLALGSLFGCGINTIEVYTQYARDSIDRYIEEFWAPVLSRDQRLRTVRSTSVHGYRGTADAVFSNLGSIKKIGPSHVVVTAADHACWIDYQHFFNFHQSRGADLSIAVLQVSQEAAAGRLGVLKVDSRNKVSSFEEKPKNPGPHPLASMGIYIFKTEFLIGILERIAREYLGRHDFGHDVIPLAIASGAKVYAHTFDDYWEDLGSIKTYYYAQINDLLGNRPRFNPYVNPFAPELGIRQKMLAPVNIHEAAITDGVLIGPGCEIERSLIKQAILSPEVKVESEVNLSGAIIHHGARVGHGSRLERVIIGAGVTLPPNTIITPEKVNFVGRYFQGKFGITVVV